MELENGMFASLDPSWARPATWPTWGGLTMDVIGDRGVVAMNAFNQTLQRYDDRAGRYSLRPWTEGGDPTMLRAFFDAIEQGTAPPITGEDGLHAMEVALCAYESARRHEPVACPGVLAGEMQ
jgi:predicted dehydrogenase